ncbi:hypothetical protein ACFCXT_19740 [Streptomyces vinaceus]|uniref:hypothetical protein n=1 Tax=Streptomyces vinaceus TaxID=1960 RepID=UPI0035DFCAFD
MRLRHGTMMRISSPRWIAVLGCALIALLVCVVVTGLNRLTAPGPDAASAPGGHAGVTRATGSVVLWRAPAVRYADQHWSWARWNGKKPPVGRGSATPGFQCAEYVARSLAAAGLIPGLSSDAPQPDYGHYSARNGKEYDLLLISDRPGFRTLYDFLLDSRLGIDVGDRPDEAQPGDVVVSFDRGQHVKLHTGLVVRSGNAGAQPLMDAHNDSCLACELDQFDLGGDGPRVPHVILIRPAGTS